MRMTIMNSIRRSQEFVKLVAWLTTGMSSESVEVDMAHSHCYTSKNFNNSAVVAV